MKLVTTRLANSDSIVTDDGLQLGVIYYVAGALDDAGTLPADLFRKWFAAYDAAAKELLARAKGEETKLTGEEHVPFDQPLPEEESKEDVPPSPAG